MQEIIHKVFQEVYLTEKYNCDQKDDNIYDIASRCADKKLFRQLSTQLYVLKLCVVCTKNIKNIYIMKYM